MIIPNLPREPLLTINKDTKMPLINPAWQAYHNNLTKQLQSNLSDEGYVIPQQPQANINTLNTMTSQGRFIFNSDNSSMQMNNNGTYQSIVGAQNVNGITAQTTVGSSGAASPTPASPDKYWKMTVDGTDYVLPLYKAS